MSKLSKSTKNMISSNSVRFSRESFSSNKITLYEELRLIERNENEIHVMWKGAHMMLFFLAFVFGSFCTCCFHMIMRMFDNKCVLFPRLVSHKSLRLIVYEFFSIKLEGGEDEPNVPPDFVSTKWADNSVCYLPTYVPLMSGLGGLVWATMFLMCSHSSTVTGPPRHWRALPFIFLFSVVMAALCAYSSVVTHTGLAELCIKLDEVTGSSMSSYTINVATLAYERRIRGVYQATRLTIAAAWMHTMCWAMSALLVLARVLLAVDFTLVTVRAQVVGGVDTMLQKLEDQINSISPDSPEFDEGGSEVELFATNPRSRIKFQISNSVDNMERSDFSLVPEEKNRLILKEYIEELLSDLLNDVIERAGLGVQSAASTFDFTSTEVKKRTDQVMNTSDSTRIFLDTNEMAKEVTQHHRAKMESPEELLDVNTIAQEFMRRYKEKLNQGLNEFERLLKSNLKVKLDKSTDDPKHFLLYIADHNVNKELPNIKNTEEDKYEEIDNANKKSVATSSSFDRITTQSYVRLNENTIADKRTKIYKKDVQFKDSSSRELRIYDNKNTEKEKKSMAFEHTLTPSYNEIVEENKRAELAENKLENKDNTNENETMERVHKPLIIDESNTTTTTPENEDIELKNNEELRIIEKKEKGDDTNDNKEQLYKTIAIIERR